jgi:hypothetical protein
MLNHTDSVMIVLLFSRDEFADYIHESQIRQTQADVGHVLAVQHITVEERVAIALET